MTAYRWAKDPEVRRAVETYRRRIIDQAIGVMTSNDPAAGVIAKIATEGESDTVRLRACRAIFSDMMAVSKYSGLEGRLTEIEDHYRARSSQCQIGRAGVRDLGSSVRVRRAVWLPRLCERRNAARGGMSKCAILKKRLQTQALFRGYRRARAPHPGPPPRVGRGKTACSCGSQGLSSPHPPHPGPPPRVGRGKTACSCGAGLFAHSPHPGPPPPGGRGVY